MDEEAAGMLEVGGVGVARYWVELDALVQEEGHLKIEIMCYVQYVCMYVRTVCMYYTYRTGNTYASVFGFQ